MLQIIGEMLSVICLLSAGHYMLESIAFIQFIASEDHDILSSLKDSN